MRSLWTEKLSSDYRRGKSFGEEARTAFLDVARQQVTTGRILGIDPSLRGTGIALLDVTEKGASVIFSQKISCPARLSVFECIGIIFRTIRDILEQYEVNQAAIEQTVYVQNYRIAHLLGAVRGAIIAALMNKNISIFEYEPLRIKQAVTGFGRATKEQVKRTVCGILKIDTDISYDEGDAAAVALCHVWSNRFCVPGS